MNSVPRRWVWVCAGMIAVAVTVLLGVLGYGGGAPEPAVPGLPDPGLLTGWGLPVARLAFDACGAVVVGLLVTGLVLAPVQEGAVRAGGRWALGWAVCAVAIYVLTRSNIAAEPVLDVLTDRLVLLSGLSTPDGVAPLVVAVLALMVAFLTTRRSSRLPLVVAVAGLLPMVYVGHAASADDHDIAISSMAVHVVAVAVWVGGLGGVMLYLRRSDRLPAALARFSTIALCCFVAVAVSGLTNAWVRIGAVRELWDSPYGQLVVAKALALVGLGVFGWTHRRRTVEAVAEHPVRRTFLRLATSELVVMAAAVALAVGLSRTPPPSAAGGHQHLGLDYDLDPFTVERLFTAVRVDPLIVLALLGAYVAYLVGVRRVGRSWPVPYLLSWLAGLCLLALVLVGGFSGFSRALFLAHAVQQVVLNVIAPLLLVLAAPLTLAARALTPSSQYGEPAGAFLDSSFARRVTHPAVVMAVYSLTYLLLYLTGWFEFALSNHPAHLITQVVLVVTGLLFFWVVVGTDPLPRPVSWRVRLAMIAGALAIQLAFCVLCLFGPLLAGGWLLFAAPPLAPDLVTSQQLGAVLATSGASASLLVAGAVLVARRGAAARRLALSLTGGPSGRP